MSGTVSLRSETPSVRTDTPSAGQHQPDNLEERVRRAAEACLGRDGAVGPLQLLQQMLLLHPTHFQAWQKGNPHYVILEAHIQCGAAKLARTYQYFRDWVRQRGLVPVEASYVRSTPRGPEPLRITLDGDPVREQFFRTHHAPAVLTENKAQKLRDKLHKPPDLIVFELTGKASACSECQAEIFRGSLLFMERNQPLCLPCADLDHLEFLPSGDAALSRRARKYSSLAAVVVRFGRTRKRYERQGLLVTVEALARAEQECTADAAQRTLRRERDADRRLEGDREFVIALTQAIQARHPGCPAEEAHRIARHTALRGSGRIGRSAAGRALEAEAIDLAVIAWVRHQHTAYDSLLMQGTDRLSAREMIRPEILRVLSQWSER
jgi:hypothetical protein